MSAEYAVDGSLLYQDCISYLNELALTLRATKTQVLSDRDRMDAEAALGHLRVALVRFDCPPCNPECRSSHTYQYGCALLVANAGEGTTDGK